MLLMLGFKTVFKSVLLLGVIGFRASPNGFLACGLVSRLSACGFVAFGLPETSWFPALLVAFVAL